MMHMNSTSSVLPVHRSRGVGYESELEPDMLGRRREDLESIGEVFASSLPLMRPFLRRALRVNQMDFETALDEMLSLCLGQPGQVFKLAYYRKQTKNRWARDDPAFAVCQVGLLVVATLATGAALKAQRTLTYVYLACAAALVHWLALGLLASSTHAWLANRFLREKTWSAHSVDQKVEWLYAFDVHCNAFFVYFTVAYVAHYFVLPISLGHSFLAMAVANAVHAIAFAGYFYITHLGFRALPFLRNTELFLYPSLLALALFALSIVLGVFGIKCNSARYAAAAVIAPLPLY